jgi:hypothetical protein
MSAQKCRNFTWVTDVNGPFIEAVVKPCTNETDGEGSQAQARAHVPIDWAATRFNAEASDGMHYDE